jgi:hypothetical protein
MIVVSLFVIELLSFCPQLALGEESVKKTLVGELPSAIQEKAKQTFESGKKCYIWNDTNTSVSVQSFFGATLVIVGGISVIASPQADEIAFLQRYRFIAKDISTGEAIEINGSTAKQTKETASSKERRFFGVLIGGRDKKTGKESALSGKATFQVYLADRLDEGKDNPAPISNTTEIEADLDKLSSIK